MPWKERMSTGYPGVYYILGLRSRKRKGKKEKEKIYYIMYRRAGKPVEEKAGRQFQDHMTPAKAAGIRAKRVEGKDISNTERRESEKAAKLAAAGRYTLAKLWDEYKTQKPDSVPIKFDGYRFKKYLKPKYGDKIPSEIDPLEIYRLRISLLKVKSPQTVKHILGLLKRLCNFGVEKRLCQGLNFKIKMPLVDNQKTEDLSTEQLQRLLTAIDESMDLEAANIMRMALFTGMRRGELIKLMWVDIDYDRGFINIRNPKGGVSQKIPLNSQARNVLKNHPRTGKYVFVRSNKQPFTNVINKRVRVIRKAAGLPDDFRPLHGLRHHYASILASSGVDLYTVQKLLTHKSPGMTARYAHLRDEALKRASDLAGNIIEQSAKTKEPDSGSSGV